MRLAALVCIPLCACDHEKPPSSTICTLARPAVVSCLSRGALDVGTTERAISVAWAPTDDHALVGAVGSVRLVHVDPTANRLTTLASYREQPGRITVAWSPDGQYALSVSADVRLLRVSRERPGLTELARTVTHDGHVMSAKWSPDGRTAVTTGNDSSVRVLEILPDQGSVQEIARFDQQSGRVFTVSWSPDGTHVLTGGEDGTARVLEVDVGAGSLREVTRLHHVSPIVPVSWSSRGEMLLGTWAACDAAVELVGVDMATATMKVRSTIVPQPSWLRALEWSPDGACAVSGGHDDTVVLLCRYEDSMRVLDVLPRDGLGVHAASWSPTGEHFLFAASQEDQVTLVDVRGCLGRGE